MNSIIIYFFLTWANRHFFNWLFKRLAIRNKTFIATNILAFLISAFEITIFNSYPFKNSYDFGIYLRLALLFLVFPQIVWWSCDNIKRAIYRSRKLKSDKLDKLINQISSTLVVGTLFAFLMYYFKFGKAGGPHYYNDLYRLGLIDVSAEGWFSFLLMHVQVWIAFYIPFAFLAIFKVFYLSAASAIITGEPPKKKTAQVHPSAKKQVRVKPNKNKK